MKKPFKQSKIEHSLMCSIFAIANFFGTEYVIKKNMHLSRHGVSPETQALILCRQVDKFFREENYSTFKTVSDRSDVYDLIKELSNEASSNEDGNNFIPIFVNYLHGQETINQNFVLDGHSSLLIFSRGRILEVDSSPHKDEFVVLSSEALLEKLDDIHSITMLMLQKSPKTLIDFQKTDFKHLF